MTLRKLFFTLRLSRDLPYPAGLLYILFLIAASNSSPQSRYTHYGASEGLSQLNVRSIVQDKQGFLWVATWDGLNHFDGYQFRIYQHDLTDSNTISNNNVLFVKADQRDRIWAQFPDGRINIYDKKTRRFHLMKNPDGTPFISSSLHPPIEDDHGLLWTSSNEMVWNINPDNFEIRAFKPKIMRDAISGARPALVLGEKKKIYILYPDSTFFVYNTDFPYYSLLFTSDNRVLFTTVKGELFELEYRTGTSRLLANFITSKGVPTPLYTVYEDKAGNIWAGTSEELYICENFAARDSRKVFKRISYTSSAEKPNETVYAVFSDSSDVLWVGTISGLYKVNPVRKKITFLPAGKLYRDLFGDSFPISMLRLSDGRLLTGTTNGLYVYNPIQETAHRFTRQNSGYSGQPAYCIYKDAGDRIWAGTRFGLNRYDAGSGRFKEYIFADGGEPSALLNRIYGVTVTDDGRYWAATAGGLIEFNPDDKPYTIHTFPSSSTTLEGKSYILSLLADQEYLWAGTNGEGLLKISLKDMSYIRFFAKAGDPNSLSGNKIMAIYRDRQDRLWVATMGSGLNLLAKDEKSFRHFTASNGLSNNTVYGILEDNLGDIWVSTNAGLSRINGTTLEISHYGSNHLPSVTEFNQNSYYKSPDGTLYFGGMRGIITFRPEELTDNPHKPRIAITDFLLFNKSRPDLMAAKEIHLNYNENFFSFELAALLYDQPGSNQYAYRLKGLHEEWIYLGNRRNADLSNIEPGEYILAAKAANEDGIWSDEQELVRITIIPPFWRTGWFYSLILLLLVSAVVLSVRFYIRKKYKERIAQLEKEKLILEERNKTRDRIARDLHDDLASTVSSAGLYLQSVLQMFSDDQESAMQYLQKSASILNKAEQSMSDIVWSVSPNYDTLDNLILRIRLIGQELCTASGIRLEFSSSGEGSVNVSEELRRNIYLSAKECIVNAVRHSSCSEIRITASLSVEVISISILDNGAGFSVSEQKSSLGGNGLINIRKRLQEINGRAEFVSEQGKGTTVTLSAPLSAEKK